VAPLAGARGVGRGAVAGITVAAIDGARRTATVRVGPAVTTTIRHRRHDFAVLRALGATRRQIRSVVASQATTIGLVGIVIGVPLGLVLGRAGWRWVADSVPFIDDSPVAVLATILVVPAVLVAVNLLAGVPARGAARAHPAEVLRTE
jgi:ABC-type antimicrobial peptide transport system permease subunit